MIRTLKLESYRGFEAYRLRELGTVNLLVGPNNCGKTSVLEAVQLLVSQGDPRVLVESARRRSESHSGEDRARVVRYPLRHHFHGHTLEPGVSLAVSSRDGFGRVRIRIVEGELGETADIFTGQPLALSIRAGGDEDPIRFPLTENGSLDWSARAVRHAASMRSTKPPVQFVTAESLHTREMAGSWNRVIREGRELEVVETMRILQKDLQSIHFLTGDSAGSGGGLGGVLLGFRDGRPRIPIGSHGDGMRRLLALSLSLVRTAGGFLLIDEIDTGLHWTIMEEMWNLVIDAAVAASIQVFATTHSLDCIVGLAALLRKKPNLGEAVSVHKIERQLDQSVSFGAEDIVTAADLSIELR